MYALAANSDAANTAGTVFAAILIGVISLAAYWTPAAIAWIRHIPNAGSVTVINGFFGWTVAGWIIALAMACRSRPQLNTPHEGTAQ